MILDICWDKFLCIFISFLLLSVFWNYFPQWTLAVLEWCLSVGTVIYSWCVPNGFTGRARSDVITIHAFLGCTDYNHLVRRYGGLGLESGMRYSIWHILSFLTYILFNIFIHYPGLREITFQHFIFLSSMCAWIMISTKYFSNEWRNITLKL